jgi:hypothetical protein
MGLVSALYRQVASDGYVSKEESERRLKLAIRRLVNQYGKDEVVRRIRAYAVTNEQDETRKAWLVLEAWSVPDRHRSGTL